MQKHVNLVDLVKSFPTNIYLQNLASIEKRTSPVIFAHLAEKSGKSSISNLSTKLHLRVEGAEDARDRSVAGRVLDSYRSRREDEVESGLHRVHQLLHGEPVRKLC